MRVCYSVGAEVEAEGFYHGNPEAYQADISALPTRDQFFCTAHTANMKCHTERTQPFVAQTPSNLI